MRNLHKKPAVRKTIAIVCLTCGAIGVALPIVPGWIFLGVGLYLYSIDSPKLQGKIHHYRSKHRTLDNALKRSYDKLHAKHTVAPKTTET